MKLYTEEQVREAIELAREGIRVYRVNEFETEKEFDHSEDDILTSLTPIELLSDDKIEEAAKKYYEDNQFKSNYPHSPYSFIDGAKWQAERMYCEEEVLELLNKREAFMDSVDNIFEYQSINQWFEQFKK